MKFNIVAPDGSKKLKSSVLMRQLTIISKLKIMKYTGMMSKLRSWIFH